MTQIQTTDITVRSMNGTYQTNSIKGVKASCTTGERHAAERMGAKLYGQSLVTVEALSRDGGDTNTTHWRLHAEPVHAWAWQSGLIEFGREVPEGALKFATGIDTKLREQVGALARHGKGKSKGKLLVPGIPESETDNEAVDALIAWVKQCGQRNGKSHACGVVFARS